MAVLPKMNGIYESVSYTWYNFRADIISHFFLFFIMFKFIDVSLPEIPIPQIDPNQIIDNGWFKLAKESGILIFTPFLVIGLVIVYTVLFRALGMFTGSLLRSYIPIFGMGFDPVSYVDFFALESIAMTLDNDRFQYYDISSKAHKLIELWRNEKNDQWQNIERTLHYEGSNIPVYVNNISSFLFIWIMLFLLLPENAKWKVENVEHFWTITLMLVFALIVAWSLMSKESHRMSVLTIEHVGFMLWRDPEVNSILDRYDEKRVKIRGRLKELRLKEESLPSLRRFLWAMIQDSKPLSNNQYINYPDHPISIERRLEGFPFPKLYRRGQRFEANTEHHQIYDDKWLSEYFAYIYYRAHRSLILHFRYTWSALRRRIKGW
jgi:hypothetical protein